MGLEIFQNFHEIFKYFEMKYFIVHLYPRCSIDVILIFKMAAAAVYTTSGCAILLTSLTACGRNLPANQISSTYLNPQLIYSLTTSVFEKLHFIPPLLECYF